MLADLHGDVAAHQRDVVVDHTAGLDRALIAPQDRADAREQLAERVGLGHVIVRADLQTDDFVDLGAFGGEHDDRTRLCSRMRRHRAVPSMPGSIRSSSTRSMPPLVNSSRPSSPLAAAETS